MKPLRRVSLSALVAASSAFVLVIAALLLGGASRGATSAQLLLASLSVATIPVILWRLTDGARFATAALAVTGAFAVFLAIAALGLVQIPLELMAELPGRRALADAYRLAGMGPDAPLAFDPLAARIALFSTIGPLIFFLLVSLMDGRTLRLWGPRLLLLAAGATALLGIMQFTAPRSELLFPYGSAGRTALGLFANPNHCALFLAMCLPIAGLVLARARRDDAKGRPDPAGMALAASTAFLALVCIILTRSFAGLVLGLLGIGSILLLNRRLHRRRYTGQVVLVGVMVAAGLLLALFQLTTPLLEGVPLASFFGGEASRGAIAQRTLEAVGEFSWLGSGIGGYEAAIRLFENPDTVTSQFINHAHNEALQLVFELGAGGVLVVLLVLAGWFWLAGRAWLEGGSSAEQAVSISLLFLMVHSLVDYPARAPAIAFIAMGLIALALASRRR